MSQLLKDDLDTHKDQPERRPLLVLIWVLAAIVEGTISIGLLFKHSAGIGDPWALGISKISLVILGGILLGVMILSLLAYLLWRSEDKRDRLSSRISRSLNFPLVYYALVIFTAAGIFAFSQFYNFSTSVSDPYVQGYLTRLAPLMFWVSGLCIHTLLLLPLFRYGSPDFKKLRSNTIYRNSGIILIIILVIWAVIAITGIGIHPDKAGWDAPGVPFLPSQLNLVWLAAVLFLIFEIHLGQRIKYVQADWIFDAIISAILWILAFSIWSHVPLTPDYFAPEPRAPNFEIYPHSDAALHDLTAQKLLVGEGFSGIPRKPLYAMFLAFAHSIAGQDYLDVVRVQIAFLALFPVLVYLLTKRLHHRVSGLLAGGLLILRERNAIGLSGEIGVSHSKLLMSDLPAATALVLITIMLVWWLKNPSRKRFAPLGIGGGIGLILLLRPQFSLIIPVIVLIVIIAFYKRPSHILGNLGLFAAGFVLMLSPWFYRSYQQTGRFALNDPNQMAFLTEQYRLEPGTEMVVRQTGETEADYIQHINDYLKNFILEHPGVVAKFTSSHFVHNEIEMVQVLPLSFWYVQNSDSDLFPQWRNNWDRMWDDCCSVQSYIDASGFWDKEQPGINSSQILPMILNLLIIAIGLAAVWKAEDITGLIPFGLSLMYSISTAIGRYSGWRLILPADWVVTLYYSIGIGQATLWMVSYFSDIKIDVRGKDDDTTWGRIKEIPKGLPSIGKTCVILCAILLVLGFIPVFVEVLIPQKYPPVEERGLLVSRFLFNDEEVAGFLESDLAVVLEGRALYPRHYKSGFGEPGAGWAAFTERDYDRLGFILAGPDSGSVILPMEDPPETFPNAVDVLVVGCREDEFIDAAAVLISIEGSDQPEILLRPTFPILSCPLPSH